jgi:predicted aspartyl protease
MEISLMGKVIVAATIENLDDVFNSEKGSLEADRVRRLEVPDALVDTGATMLSAPKRIIEQLGLTPFRVRRVRTSAGTIDVRVYRAVRLTIQGRDCIADVCELPDDCPMLIGQLPLEMLDFVVDPAGQRLIGNPAHGGEHMIEMY